MRLNYMAWEGKNIVYVDFMNLYPYICKYFKISVVHHFIHVGDVCKNKETT